MKKSLNLVITALVALIGASIIQYSATTLSPSIAFILGAIVSAVMLQCATNGRAEYQSEADISNKTLYIGNLPFRVNEEEVKTLFSAYGEVVAVRLMKDKRTGKRRGFGFVVMPTEQAQIAIEALNNSQYQDRTLKVREANEPKKAGNE